MIIAFHLQIIAVQAGDSDMSGYDRGFLEWLSH